MQALYRGILRPAVGAVVWHVGHGRHKVVHLFVNAVTFGMKPAETGLTLYHDNVKFVVRVHLEGRMGARLSKGRIFLRLASALFIETEVPHLCADRTVVALELVVPARVAQAIITHPYPFGEGGRERNVVSGENKNGSGAEPKNEDAREGRMSSGVHDKSRTGV